VHFDQEGVSYAAVLVGSSSGKLFVPDMTPRRIEEFLVAARLAPVDRSPLRAVSRAALLEDTNNVLRVATSRRRSAGLIPNLDEQRKIGSGSSYVIAS
jgi:hypothetical protein